MTYLPRANEPVPVEPHNHESRAESWGCPTCIADEAAAVATTPGEAAVDPE